MKKIFLIIWRLIVVHNEDPLKRHRKFKEAALFLDGLFNDLMDV
jgi:hypothetical protein